MAGGDLRSVQKTTVYLPTPLHERLRAAAQREGLSQAELVREAIEARLDRSARSGSTIVGMFSESIPVTSHTVKPESTVLSQKADPVTSEAGVRMTP